MIRLYDTRKKKKLDFCPLHEGKVGIYVCGVTVYDVCHVGHARTSVAFDVIVRHLRAAGFDVRFVRNITDVDDKIIRRAQQEGLTAGEVARKYAAVMTEDMRLLGVAPPDEEPLATENIPQMHDLIANLIEKKLAYPAQGDVYFSVPGYKTYGQLSGQSPDDLRSGARIEVDESKNSPLDFALWKGAKPGEPQWQSPWGPGRPGWHIECSAMANRYLGEKFDIHGGGADLIFPHHENEIAQSQGAFGEDNFAQHWMHSGMVTFGGEKMSKSMGNVVGIRKVGDSHDYESLRLLMISVHYRSPVTFDVSEDDGGNATFPSLDEQEDRLDYFYRSLERIDQYLAGLPNAPTDVPESSFGARYKEAMNDDFNTAAAIGCLYDAFVFANKLLDDPKAVPEVPKKQRAGVLCGIARDVRDAGKTLGICTRMPGEFLLGRRARLCARMGIDEKAVAARIQERIDVRKEKDFARADEIRALLRTQGVELMDTPSGTTWRVVAG